MNYNPANLLAAFHLTDLFDVIIIAAFIYFVIIFIRQTRSYFILSTVILLAGIDYLATKFNLSLTRQFFTWLLTFFLVIFVVIFQREIRRFFEWFTLTGRRLSKSRQLSLSAEVAEDLATALRYMAAHKIGGIVVLPGDQPLDQLVDSGFALDGVVSTPLLLSIFDPTSPGHDGAVLIDNNRLKRFGLHLPLAEDFKKYPNRGTRHRAALGITEKTDAIALIVSEERGEVSLADGKSLRSLDLDQELESVIHEHMKENILEGTPTFLDYFVVRNFWAKVASLLVAFGLWFFIVFQAGVASQVYSVPIEFKFLPPNYTLEQVEPNQVKVTLTGSNQDLSSVSAANIKVTVDLSAAPVGYGQKAIGPLNVSYPPFLTLTDVSPKTVSFKITQTKTNPSP